MPSKHIFDKADLLENFDGDEDLVRSILDQAIPEIEKDVEKLLAAYRSGDLTAVSHCAHSTKGMASNLCTPALQEVCRQIETAITAGDLETVRSLMSELELTTQMTLAAIRD